MLTVNRLRELLIEVKAKIITIKYAQIIIDDSEFSKFLEERKPAENTMLFAVLPDHSVQGSQDKLMYNNYLRFFILNKAANKNMKHDDKLDLYNDVQLSVNAFIKLIVNEKSGEDGDFCGILTFLKEDSLSIDLVWDKQQCWGYDITFEIKTQIA